MRLKLLSIREEKEDPMNIDSDLSKENLLKKTYVLETPNQARLVFVNTFALEEENSLSVLREVFGEVYAQIPKLKAKDYHVLEKIDRIQNGDTEEKIMDDSIMKDFMDNKNVWEFIDYLEKKQNVQHIALNLAPNDIEILSTVLSKTSESDLGKMIFVEINEEQSKKELMDLDEQQKEIIKINSNNRLLNQYERSKFNIFNIVKRLSEEYKNQFNQLNDSFNTTEEYKKTLHP